MVQPLFPRWRWPLAGLYSLLIAAVGVYFGLKLFGGHHDRTPLASDHTPGFRDVARASGIDFHMSFLPNEQGAHFKINLYDHGCGVAVGDYDGDGRDDIYFVNQLGPNALYRNKGDGTFEDVTEKAGVGLGDRVCVAATWADYDNSGRQSLFVTSTRGGNVLFKNMGNGKFKDVTQQAGVSYIGHSQTAVFFDYDNDGYLDLLVTNTAQWTDKKLDSAKRYYPGLSGLSSLAGSPIEHNILYHNNHDGTFTDVTKRAGLEGKGWGGDVTVFDYDGDGWPDVLITNMFGASQLYHNEGNGTFRDVTRQTLGKTSWGAIGSKAFDYDNDGKLDLLIVDMHSDMWMPGPKSPYASAAKLREWEHKKFRHVTGPLLDLYPESPLYNEGEKTVAAMFHIQYGDVVFGNTLFHNLGGGKFAEVSDQAGMETMWPWGIAVGDFNNDGFQDVYLPAGMGHPFVYWPSSLMMNRGNGTFVDCADAEGIEPPAGGIYQTEPINGEPAPRSSRCAAVADFSGNGRLDIVVNNFNDVPYYYKNQFPKRNYIAFRLHGTRCNRDAIGALVTLYQGKRVMVRQVDPAGGYLSQSSKTVHFGLGDATSVDRVEIRWPGQKHADTMDHPAINTLHNITQANR